MLYRFQDFELDPKQFQLRRAGEPVDIPRQVFDLILFLARNHERPVTRNELVSHVWGGRTVSDGSLTRCLSLARKALGDNPRQNRFIKTIHGRGYWFVAPVEVVVERDGGLPKEAMLPRDLPFVGRVDEMSKFLEGLAAARESRGSLALLEGPAGIGKSRLCRELRRRAREVGFATAFVDCAALGPAVPLAPWIEAVRRSSSGAKRDRAVAVTAPSMTQSMAPEWERLRRFSLLADLILEDVPNDSAFAVLLDNIDRADSDSRLFLRYLSDLLPGSRVVVVISARDDPLQPISGFDEDVRRADGWLANLDPFSPSDVEDLLARIGPSAAGIETTRLLSRSGGNPLFLEELLRVPAYDEASVPPSLVGAVLRRVGAMSELTSGVLARLSVLGKYFRLEDAAELLGIAPGEVTPLLGPAVDRGLLAGPQLGSGLLFFRHEIVQEALYSNLDPIERARLHARAAAKLEGVAKDDGLAELAHHHVRSLPLGDPAVAYRSLLDAAGWAERKLAFGQACDLLESALNLCRDGRIPDSNEAAVRLRLGGSLVRAGRRKRGREILLSVMEAVEDLETGALGEAVLSLAPGFFAIEVGVCDSLLIGVLERSSTVPDMEAHLRARLLARLAMAMYWQERSGTEAVSAVVQRSLDHSAMCGVAEVVAECGIWLVGAQWSWVSAESRPALLGAESEAELLDPASRMVRRAFLIATAVEKGDRASVEREVGRFEVDAQLTREPHSQWYLPMYRGMLALGAGRLEEARAEVATLVEVGSRLGDENVGHCAVAQAAEIAFQENRSADLLPALRDHAQMYYRMSEYRCVLAFFELAAGDLAAAHSVAADVLGDYASGSRRIKLDSLIALSALAEVAYAAADETMGGELLEAIRPAQRLHAVAGYGVLSWGSMARPIGYLQALEGSWREARSSMETAIRTSREAGNLVWSLHAELGLARVLAREGPSDLRRKSEAIALSVASRSRASGLRYLEAQASVLGGAQ